METLTDDEDQDPWTGFHWRPAGVNPTATRMCRLPAATTGGSEE